jgi:RNA 2',3'-cyclic 3'-phosphodiesterase
VRLFVALSIPESVRKALSAVQDELRSSLLEARLVPPENFHVTLKFIGHAPGEQLPAIIETLQAVRANGPVSARFCGLGYSFKPKRGGVFWCTMQVSDGLKAIAIELNDRLEKLGFASENRDFLPHLTLARLKEDKTVQAIRGVVDRYRDHDFGQMQSDDFVLMESRTNSAGATYTPVAAFPLTIEAKKN